MIELFFIVSMLMKFLLQCGFTVIVLAFAYWIVRELMTE